MKNPLEWLKSYRTTKLFWLIVVFYFTIELWMAVSPHIDLPEWAKALELRVISLCFLAISLFAVKRKLPERQNNLN